MPVGTLLRIVCREPAIVHWSADDWRTTRDDGTRDGGCGVHYLDVPTTDLAPGSRVVFSFRWLSPERRQGTDYAVEVCERGWCTEPKILGFARESMIG